ncbi:uncharacterized protein F5891DRAFT_986187 [Suillus fuscotomentosus]|uniref:Redoxin domain-containing protein n=1 Tax=Suillus fuscotomentosus TaxID=1912939 RepID=A0AAD4DSH9_9AGAM|nr:uncharacterized protein F5891DRAFT_986187 [Suillus fuscotomentosus]KAG1893121.1 hypothetical protein F5891DRAFT_986187 [Suillus fuscotomentosus]
MLTLWLVPMLTLWLVPLLTLWPIGGHQQQHHICTLGCDQDICLRTFGTVPFTEDLADHSACRIPTELSIDSWKGKMVVLFSVPGAFTICIPKPTCHINHLPPYIANYDKFTVNVIVIVAANDPFVMSGWGCVEGLTGKAWLVLFSAHYITSVFLPRVVARVLEQ